jgi:hypothetical protein
MVGRACGCLAQVIHAEVLHTITPPAPPASGGLKPEHDKCRISERAMALDTGKDFWRPALKYCSLEISAFLGSDIGAQHRKRRCFETIEHRRDT